MHNDEISIQNLYEEILNNRSELKHVIEACEARILLKLEEANRKITHLEEENACLKKQVEFLDRENRRNNIALFGLKKPQNSTINENYVCEELNRLLGTNLRESDICNIFPLPKTEKCPVRIKLCSHQQKREIFRNCFKLKGCRVSIANDLTVDQQREHNILRRHLTLTRLDNRKSVIRGNKLIVDNIIYSAEDLLKIDDPKETKIHKNTNSAPPTPNKPATSTETRENKAEETLKNNETLKKTASIKKTPTAVTQTHPIKYKTRSGSSSKK